MNPRAASMFTNQQILSWLNYYADPAELDLEKVKIIDITRKNRNLIPTVQANRTVLVLTDAGHPDIFYSMWDAGLGDCEIWYNEGSEPVGEIKHDLLKDMINRGINASAGMVIVNPNAGTASRIGLDNASFSSGSIHYVGREIRSVIMNRLHVSASDVLCIVSGESIAVEAAMIASEGSVIAVERDRSDRFTMEENVQRFGLNNVAIVDNLEPGTLTELPIPTIGFLVADRRLESSIAALIARNPDIEIVVYTLELDVLAKVPELFRKFGIGDMEAIQISVSALNRKGVFETQPIPWIISGKAGQA